MRCASSDLIERGGLGQVADDEPIGRHRRAMAEDEVVVDPDVVAARQEAADRVAADVAGPPVTRMRMGRL